MAESWTLHVSWKVPTARKPYKEAKEYPSEDAAREAFAKLMETIPKGVNRRSVRAHIIKIDAKGKRRHITLR